MSSIPRVFHYVWLGDRELPAHLKVCVESWQKCNPNFELRFWSNDCVSEFPSKFLDDAVRKSKWAFAADYLRLAILKKYGGVYLDTDMYAVRTINESLLEQDFFIGEESPGQLSFGVIGSTPQGQVISFMLDCYRNIRLDTFDPPIIPKFLSRKVTETPYSLKIESQEVFYPLPYGKRDLDFWPFVSEKTLFVHLWDHSWAISEERSTITKLAEIMFDVLFYNLPMSCLVYYIRLWVFKSENLEKPSVINYH